MDDETSDARRDRAEAPRHVVLVGLMGSGKTSVGARLAERLGRPYRDSDADLARATGRSARAIAADEGIDHLHALELRHLLERLADHRPSVISAAASVIDEPEALEALADPELAVVWLWVDPATAARRAARGDHRPQPETLAAQASRRDPSFERVSDIRVDTTTATPAAIVDDLIGRLSPGRTR